MIINIIILLIVCHQFLLQMSKNVKSAIKITSKIWSADPAEADRTEAETEGASSKRGSHNQKKEIKLTL